METTKFLVQGSAKEPYVVIFSKKGNNIRAQCNCPAGENGMYCKHRLRILAGSTEGIISANINDVEIVKNWLKGSDIENVMDELRQAEEELEKMKTKVSALKKNLARKLFD